MTRPRVTLLTGLLILAMTASAGAAWLLFTATGSRLLVRAMLSHVLPAQRVSIARITGTLHAGMTFEGIVLEGLKGVPVGHHLLIDRLDIGLSLSHLDQTRVQGRYLRLAVPGLAERVTAAKLEGSPITGWRLTDVEASGLPRLPAGARLAVQGVKIDVLGEIAAVWQRGRIAITNARLMAPAADPIVFDGTWTKGQLSLNAYTNSLTPADLRPFFPSSRLLQLSSGTVGDVSVRLSGDWQRPDVEASFLVQQLSRKGFVLSRAPGVFTGALVKVGRSIDVHGTLLLKQGRLTGRDIAITLQPSRLFFSGTLRNPTYDMKGTAVIAGTKIRITLTGTRIKPEMRLASSPPLPQERLLLMLATGRSLAGRDANPEAGEISSDLAADFIDYLLFDGQGSRLAQRVGITGLSLMYQPETNTGGLKTTLVDKLSVTYQAEQPRPDERLVETGEPLGPVEHTLGVEYKVTDTTSLKVEGERELLSPGSSVTGPAPIDPTNPGSHTRDELRLKLEKRF